MKKRAGYLWVLIVLISGSGCGNEQLPKLSTERGPAVADVYLEEIEGRYYPAGENKEYSGRVVYNLENGKKYAEEVIREGLVVGRTTYNADGSIKERIEFAYEGTQPAVTTTYYESGGMKRQFEMIPPNDDGIFHIREWYENGQLKSEVPMNENGDYHGYITIWDEQGNVMKQEQYENGELIASQ